MQGRTPRPTTGIAYCLNFGVGRGVVVPTHTIHASADDRAFSVEHHRREGDASVLNMLGREGNYLVHSLHGAFRWNWRAHEEIVSRCVCSLMLSASLSHTIPTIITASQADWPGVSG